MPFRRHLDGRHGPIWERECARLNIQIKHPAEGTLEPMPDVPGTEPFTRDGLLRRLVKFVSADDQVCSLPLCQESH